MTKDKHHKEKPAQEEEAASADAAENTHDKVEVTAGHLAEMEALRKEAKEYKDKYLRSLADLENARKRLAKEKQEIMRYAIEQVVCDLLHPLDNLENALRFSDQGSDEVRNWAAGFQMILSQFKDALTTHGISTFPSEGAPFDPHHHEAVEIMETAHVPEGIVVEEFMKGYRLGEKTIRPARVKVSKSPAGEKAEEAAGRERKES